MDFLKKHDLTVSKIFKIAGLAILGIVVVAIGFRLVGSSFNSVFEKNEIGYGVSPQSAPAQDYAADSETDMKYAGVGSVGLSMRNVAPTPGYTTGNDAEEFEVTEYYATVETRELDETCATIATLKARPDVVFESAGEYDRGCNYVFKVEKDKVNEILEIVKGIDPKELTESTYTIKNLIEDYTSEIEILEKKLTSIDETLQKAMDAYDDVTSLATKVQDVETLAKIIDSKIAIIERLTQARININSQLDSIARSKAIQLDRLEYTYFHINILENKFVDGENLKDSWKAAIKAFVSDINETAQDITVNLVAFLFVVLQFALYLLILLVIVKYGWKFTKSFWKK
ncbi:MAG TPA: hypothetical protein VMX18_02765 [Candidatus Bipolaricaulota bacterium]|nr:hypothetical protein [Candidatus Bipolaricaulota bacterium]